MQKTFFSPRFDGRNERIIGSGHVKFGTDNTANIKKKLAQKTRCL